MPAQRHYRVQEVAELLAVPASTLRYWEAMFPMFKPNRLLSGRRRFTEKDVKLAKHIRELLYDRGLKIDAAIEMMNKTYRKAAPRRLRKCTTPQEAIALLNEVMAATEDKHATAKLKAVINFLSHERTD